MLGVSSGAAFGAVIGQLFGLGGTVGEAFSLASFASAGAVVASVVVYLIASRSGGLPVHSLLLAGVIVGIFFSAAITCSSHLDFDRLGGVVHWLLGNLAPLPPGTLALFAAATAPGLWLVLHRSRQLNLLALGEEAAAQLGVDTARLNPDASSRAPPPRRRAPSPAWGRSDSWGSSSPTPSACPGTDNRMLVPTAALAGGRSWLVADTLARNVVAPAELSVGVITAFCGAPFFVYSCAGARSGASPP